MRDFVEPISIFKPLQYSLLLFSHLIVLQSSHHYLTCHFSLILFTVCIMPTQSHQLPCMLHTGRGSICFVYIEHAWPGDCDRQILVEWINQWVMVKNIGFRVSLSREKPRPYHLRTRLSFWSLSFFFRRMALKIIVIMQLIIMMNLMCYE